MMNNFDELLCTSRLKIISFNEGAHSSPFFVATSTTTHSCSMLPISANIPTFNPMSGPPWGNVGLFLYISIDEF